MPHFSFYLRGLFSVLVFSGSIPCLAQTVSMGFASAPGGSVGVSGVKTIIDTWQSANLNGLVSTATFGWSSSPCPAAVKIKFFRPASFSNGFPSSYDFLTERGPFDVTAPVANNGYAGAPLSTQTVILNPPFDVQRGDVVPSRISLPAASPFMPIGSFSRPHPPAGLSPFRGT